MHFLFGDLDRREMLADLGIADEEELFADVPREVRTTLRLPPSRSELDVRREMRAILEKNVPFERRPHFLGLGIPPHYVPALVKWLVFRSEFYTSYTPYQPEILQGILQAAFEYQTYVTRLTGMDVANVSMYDGATALAEAALMGMRASGGREVLLPRHLFWEKKSVVRNYVQAAGGVVREYGYDRRTGESSLEDLESKISGETAAVLLQNPNLFGVFETQGPEIRPLLDRKAPRALFVVDFSDPYSLALVEGPGGWGADVAVGEGASLGTGPAFGGPHVGVFATRLEHVRRMPGRIVGMTKDSRGERAFCLTLSTREQHIRREKATSNICSNETLGALAFAATLAVLGERGFVDAARTTAHRAQRLREEAGRIGGISPTFSGRTFGEFVLDPREPFERVEHAFRSRGLRGGYPLGKDLPELGNSILFSVTELHPEWALSSFIEALKEVAS